MGFLQGCFGSLAEFKLVSRVCRIGQEGEIRFAYLSHHIDTWVGREWAEVDLQLPHVAAIINVVNGDSTNGTSYIVPGRMSSRISQLNIIDILYTAYINRNYDACVKKFADNYIEKN